MKSRDRKPQGRDIKGKASLEPQTMDELRKPSTMLPPLRDEFRIVSPSSHEPEGQTTHE
jgi:hypothetical protein